MEGIRGPSVIARDIANAACVNKELYAASKSAFQHLSSFCSPILQLLRYLRPATNGQQRQNTRLASNEALWNLLVSNPASLTVKQVQSLAIAVGVPDRCSRVVTVVRLLEVLGLECPTAVAARLTASIMKEKQTVPINLITQCSKVSTLTHTNEFLKVLETVNQMPISECPTMPCEKSAMRLP